MTNHLLFELGVEELPPKALKMMEAHVFASLQSQLSEKGFAFSQLETFATARRLAFLAHDVQAQQQDKTITIKGPKIDAPQKAVEGFARKWQISLSDLETVETNNQTHFIVHKKEAGQDIRHCIQMMLQQMIDTMPIPKRMRWGDGQFSFSRPVRWFVLMLDNEVINSTLFGLNSSNETRGHSFHNPQAIALSSAGAYEATLHEAKVIANSSERKQIIRQKINQQAQTIDANVVVDEALLDEVNALTEWPTAILCSFPKAFLKNPEECLIISMKTNHKYFHLLDKNGALLPHFITIANIESKAVEKIKEGNERVIIPRLKDAEFFFNKDKESTLKSRTAMLHKMLFEKELGTVADKLKRIERLAANMLAEQKDVRIDSNDLSTTYALCKCDLLTDMVGEFPALQGVMGKYYALHDGYCESIAFAIEQHYYPRFSGDLIPNGALAQLVSLTDRIDTICGIFAIGKAPTGTSDPYALRRHAIAVLRIILEGHWQIDLQMSIVDALNILQRSDERLAQRILDFFMERLKNYFIEQKIPPQAVQAVNNVKVYQPLDFEKRLQAVVQFMKQPAALVLSDANKRIANILAKAEFDASKHQIDAHLFELPEEEKLYTLLTEMDTIGTTDYSLHYEELAEFEKPIEAFFDKVMVMTEDMNKRNNRLFLLAQLHKRFTSLADIACLQI